MNCKIVNEEVKNLGEGHWTVESGGVQQFNRK